MYVCEVYVGGGGGVNGGNTEAKHNTHCPALTCISGQLAIRKLGHIHVGGKGVWEGGLS